MIKSIQSGFLVQILLVVLCIGCSPQDVGESMKSAENSAEQSAKALANEASEMAKKGEAKAKELGAAALTFLNPLKDKLGDLDSLKDSPEKLKTAVTELIDSIEQKAENVKLPESMSQALAKLKEKLVSLKEYLQGEYDEAKIGEHLKGIMDSVKSEFGM